MDCHHTGISSIKTVRAEGPVGIFVKKYIFKLLHLFFIAVLLTACDQSEQARPVEGQVTGTVIYHESIKGEDLRDRDLVVWLPPGYDTDTEQRYPVLYMHDGQNIFDPVTSYAGVDWAIDESVDRLIREGAIEPVIVVGINNTQDRDAEYSPGEKGTAYMDFVINGVKPLIDATYRTRPERQHTLTGGASSGGTISFMLAWDHPEVFAGAICMSPAFKVGPDKDFSEFDFIGYFEATREKSRDVFFYIDNGGVELDGLLQPGIEEMLTSLEQWGYREGEDWVFIHEPTAKHFESAWAKRFPDALVLTLQAAEN
jgi:predicted alpha/beta superfamily hydrolase